MLKSYRYTNHVKEQNTSLGISKNQNASYKGAISDSVY